MPESLTPPSGAKSWAPAAHHLIVDVTDYPEPLAVGDVLAFITWVWRAAGRHDFAYVGKEYCGER